jgi:hypothetical protein
VLRYEPDNQGYQYEKELEDFIHTRQPSEDGDPVSAQLARGVVPARGAGSPGRARDAKESPMAENGRPKGRRRPHRSQAPHR